MSWEDEDFEPDAAPVVAAKWDGEDEDDVLDSWDADPAERKKAVPAPKPKAEEKKKKAEPEWNDEALSDPEAEKERQKRKQLESDLQHATDLFGVTDVDIKELAAESLNRDKLGKYEATNPSENADFLRFAKWIADDLEGKYKKSPHYQNFVKALVTEMTKNFDEVELRNLAGVLTAKAHEKVQAQKGKKKKPKKKVQLDDEADYDMIDDEYSFLA